MLRATSLLVAALCVAGMRAQQTVDLEGVLRAAYTETGEVTQHTAAVDGLREPVRYLRAGFGASNASLLVVLLHGMAFRADTWKVVGTLDAVAQAGLPCVALDLPSYSGQFAPTEVRKRLLTGFLGAIGWTRPVVVVAASMGGTVGAPYVLSEGGGGGALPAPVAGYVSVSAMLSPEGATRSSVPALLVWGELDTPTSSKAKAHERLFSTHQMVVLPEAPHPAYLKWPSAFNALLVDRLRAASPTHARGERGGL